MPPRDGAHLREVHEAAGHERGAGHEDALHQLRAGEVRLLPQGPRGQAGRPRQEVRRPRVGVPFPGAKTPPSGVLVI